MVSWRFRMKGECAYTQLSRSRRKAAPPRVGAHIVECHRGGVATPLRPRRRTWIDTAMARCIEEETRAKAYLKTGASRVALLLLARLPRGLAAGALATRRLSLSARPLLLYRYAGVEMGGFIGFISRMRFG